MRQAAAFKAALHAVIKKRFDEMSHNHHHIMRFGSVTARGGGVIAALRHNKRELKHERGNIDPLRSCLNYSLHGQGSAVELSKSYEHHMIDHSIKPRANAVLLVEILFCLPPHWHSKDTRPYFTDCYHWATEHMQGQVLSFDVHLDEAAPHAHALIMPVIDGKLQGDKCKGGIASMKLKQTSFKNEVAIKHGLRAQDKPNKLERERLSMLVLAHLKATNDPLMTHVAWDAIREAIKNAPAHWIELLGIDATKRYSNPLREVAKIFTRPQKSA